MAEKENVSCNPSSTNQHGISIKDFTGRWTKNGQPVVSNATVEIQPGQLTAIIGSVASGKVKLKLKLRDIIIHPLVDVPNSWNPRRVAS